MDKMKPVFQALNKKLIQENLTLTIMARVGKQFNLNIHEELWLNNHVAKQI